ncbi:MAG: T9SS type A sorting domain-containing protein [Sphingobacteriales bacterium]|nr:T9SS type A sorting domain-containing protein [Sphingobacteriales bacterium]
MNTQYFLLFSRWLLLSAAWIFVLLPPEARAQNAEFAPIGAKWWCSIGGSDCASKYVLYECVAEKEVQGKTCKVITWSTPITDTYFYVLPYDEDSIYTYKENGAIYIFNKDHNGFSKWFDFDLEVGDTYTIAGLICNYDYTIQTKDTVVINGFPLRRYTASRLRLDSEIGWNPSALDTTFTVTENIGTPYSLFLTKNELFCDNIMTMYHECNPHHFLCYEDNIIGYYNSGISAECAPTGINSAPNTNQTPTAYYDAATQRIVLQPINRTFTANLYQLSGQQITINYTAADIDISHLPAALYILQMSNEQQQSFYFKILKQ